MAGDPQTDSGGTSLLVVKNVARRGIAGGGSNELNSVAEPDEPLAPSPTGFDPSLVLVASSHFCRVGARACGMAAGSTSMPKHSIQYSQKPQGAMNLLVTEERY
jgi:hypothetical protein